MTEVYLIRHSKRLKVNYIQTKDSLQLQNEKEILSIEGEKLAREKFENNKFNNIDVLFSSNYVRAIGTAKYLANKNNLDINIIDNFGERKYGINDWSEKPQDFELKQLEDENYKLPNGESAKEVSDRMYKALMEIINKYQNKRIAIVTHSIAILYLLKIWCDINVKNKTCFYKGKELFKNIDYCGTFKLVFDNDKLIDVERI